MQGIMYFNRESPVEEKFLSGQELYDELLDLRKAIIEEYLSSQFSKYYRQYLCKKRKISSSTKIESIFGHSGGKLGMGWDEKYMTDKLEKCGKTIEDVEYLVLSLEKELKDLYSEFHKLAFNSLPKETFNYETWGYIKEKGEQVSVFGCNLTEIPLNEDIWKIYNNNNNREKIISSRYRQSFIGIHPKIKNKMPEHFYVRKVA